MKSHKHILALGAIMIFGSVFAAGPALPESQVIEDTNIVSGEAQMPTPPISLFSAPEQGEENMSGEINITIPYNPNEVDNPEYWTPDEPKNINLHSATEVESGPVFNMLIALVLSLLISGYIYTRAKPLMK